MLPIVTTSETTDVRSFLYWMVQVSFEASCVVIYLIHASLNGANETT